MDAAGWPSNFCTDTDRRSLSPIENTSTVICSRSCTCDRGLEIARSKSLAHACIHLAPAVVLAFSECSNTHFRVRVRAQSKRSEEPVRTPSTRGACWKNGGATRSRGRAEPRPWRTLHRPPFASGATLHVMLAPPPLIIGVGRKKTIRTRGLKCLREPPPRAPGCCSRCLLRAHVWPWSQLVMVVVEERCRHR